MLFDKKYFFWTQVECTFCQKFGTHLTVTWLIIFWNFYILANDRFTFNLEFCACTLGSILQGLFFSQGVLIKDPTIWLDRARPANTYVPPSFLGTCRFSLVAYPPPKIHLQVYNIERDRKHD
jgi:hypothetical protein